MQQPSSAVRQSLASALAPGGRARKTRHTIIDKDKLVLRRTEPLDPDRLWTIDQAVAYLGIGTSTLRSYVRTGRVQAYRMGGETGRRLFFKKADLDAMFVPVQPGWKPDDEKAR